MCDIGKGITRALTPSQRQIDFVRAAAPIVGSVTGMEAAKAAAAAGRVMSPSYAALAAQPSGYENMSSAQSAALQAYARQGAGMSTDTKWAIGIGAGVLVIGSAIMLWPK